MFFSSTVNLSCVTTTTNTDANIDTLETRVSKKVNRFENFVAKAFWLHILDRLPIDLDQTLTPLAVRDSNRGFLSEFSHEFVSTYILVGKIEGRGGGTLRPKT